MHIYGEDQWVHMISSGTSCSLALSAEFRQVHQVNPAPQFGFTVWVSRLRGRGFRAYGLRGFEVRVKLTLNPKPNESGASPDWKHSEGSVIPVSVS